ncbi:citrate synthase [Aspergillus lentulus]|uniref:Citrate synthase n=1 Tax=Aspergillus lentulus TaxID=293939 RepID=A0AAN4PNB0_ASPLE|nr:citrate synthase [Aspergillus lentulus]
MDDADRNAWLQSAIPADSGDQKAEGFLSVKDSRTGAKYAFPIYRNAVHALSFRQITADDSQNASQHSKEGLRVFDPGFRNTAVKESNITYINGKSGLLCYRGHTINALEGKTFEEIIYLLIWGTLPSQEQLQHLQRCIAEECFVPQVVETVVTSFPRNSPSVVIFIAALSAFAADRPDLLPSYVGRNLYGNDMKLVDEQIVRILAVVTVTVSLIACHKTGRPLKSADVSASMIENIVHMSGLAENSRVPAATIIATLQRLWILYADHEMTCSTAAFLHVASTQADPISSFIAAVTAGYGPLHGGAIDTAYNVMREVGTTDQVPELIAKVKRKECRLFGYGHRIYKATDPRAEAIKEILHDLTGEVPVNEWDPLLKVAFEIDRIASSDDYFTARKIFANADLYGSFVYTALYVLSVP